MAIVWNNGNDWSNSSAVNGKDSFQEHSQRMRVFRLTHPKNWRQWGHRVSEVQQSLLHLIPIDLIRGIVLARYSPN